MKDNITAILIGATTSIALIIFSHIFFKDMTEAINVLSIITGSIVGVNYFNCKKR